MVKKTQSIESKNTTFLAFLCPGWFFPYNDLAGTILGYLPTQHNYLRYRPVPSEKFSDLPHSHSPNLPYSKGVGSLAAAIRFLKVV